ncbi:MAG: SIMPL domain-containing protein [Bacteroidetes bacterium]|nr:SIMPL domain-containing protein [Fibrella sp.]
MKSFLTILLCLFLRHSASAQQADNRLIAMGDATMEVMADQAIMSINLSYGDDKDASLVYELHQISQQKLAGILKDLNVAGKDIVYAQLLTRKERDYSAANGGGPQDRIKSFQQVSVVINDMKQFAAVQRRLMSDGLTDISTVFKVSNQPELENQLLARAIGRAREKADLMAKAVSRTVKRVIRLGDAEESEAINSRNLFGGNPALNPPRYAVPLNQTTQLVRLTTVVKMVVELD